MVHELFYKMPRSLLPSVVPQVAEFVLGLSSAQGAMDAGTFVMASAELLPDATIQSILTPVVNLLRDDAKALRGVPVVPTSALLYTLRYCLHLPHCSRPEVVSSRIYVIK